MAATIPAKGPAAGHTQEEEEEAAAKEKQMEEEAAEAEEEREEEEDEEELDTDFPSSEIGELLDEDHSSLPWEEVLVNRIKAMSVTEKSLVLEAMHQCLQEQNQHVLQEEASAILVSLKLDLKQPLEKNFLFHVYGLVLRESASEDLVRKHLTGLLELSHRTASQRKGIALAVGIAAATHMELVWAILEDVGHTKFLKSPCRKSAYQEERHENANLHWKWVGSTSLLCYGQMAMQSQKQILPWVDNIASRMVYYYSCSCYDHTLKNSFLSAAVMLMKALKRESSTQGYKFTQTAELVHCLVSTLQKEPDHLVTLYRQKIILVISGLSLRPSLTPMVKSTILQTCFQKLYQLPPMEVLKSCFPALKSDPMVLYQKAMQALNLLLQTFITENKSMDEVCFLLQHTEPWLMSDRSHERRRAVHTIFLLLKCVVNYVKLTEEARPSMLGHQIGLLMLLWSDSEEFTKNHARLCVCLLLQLLVRQKESLTEFIYLNKMKNFEERGHRELDAKFHYLVQAVDDHLTVAQHTQLILTLLRALSNPKLVDGDLASHLLLMVFEDHSIKPEQVAEILQGLFQELPAISFKSAQKRVLKAVKVLGIQYTQETVEVLLTLCHPSDRQVAPLWRALATNSQLARKVMTLLYIKLKLRPPELLIRLSEQAELISMLALGTIYELLYIREYKAIVHWAFAGILVGLLTQLHYLYELGVVENIPEPQEDILDMEPLGPCSMCLEALKGLFWTTNYWEVFAHLKLLRGWELFGRPETYTEGVTLLARAMARYDCEVSAVLGQAVICLKSSEERDNIVAILIITEFLTSQELTLFMSRKIMSQFLTLGLHNPNQLVRALSLTGLSSVLMQPKKVRLLRTQMLWLVESFQKPETKDLLGLMEIVGDTLHRTGPQGIGACSLKLAGHLRQLFENEQEEVRGGAILLYGDVIYSGGRKYQQALKGHAFQSLVPLLFHLRDTCPQVVMKTKSTFLRCAILLKWEFRKQLFGKLAWGHGPSAESDIFMCMVESNFSSCHQFLLQASVYLQSPHRNLKLTAMKFIGCILQDYFTNLCFYLKKGEIKLFQTQFEVLKQEQDSASRRFYQNFLHEVVELSRYVNQ